MAHQPSAAVKVLHWDSYKRSRANVSEILSASPHIVFYTCVYYHQLLVARLQGHPGGDVTPEQLSQCATLFSEHYAVWGPGAIKMSKYLKAGTRVKMSASKLELQSLQPKESTHLATCTSEGRLIGHAFSTSWNYGPGIVCWITQLVVHKDARRRGIATFLLQSLKRIEHTAYGLSSSQPAACLAALRLGRANPLQLDLQFTKSEIRAVLDTTPIDYIKTAEPHGSLFSDTGNIEDTEERPVCTLFTSFFVDRAEPTETLTRWKTALGNKVPWPLGYLPEGHEYLVLVKAPGPDM